MRNVGRARSSGFCILHFAFCLDTCAVLLLVDDGRLWSRVMAENEGLERVVNRRMSDGFAGLDQRVTDVKQELTGGLARVERKLDRLIDSQTSPSAPPSRRVRPSKRRR